MYREILFRAKREVTSEWLYGSLLIDDSQSVCYILDNVDGLGHNVKKETIGQYINFKDKNDMKIFEGDIVIADKRKGTVVFKNNSFLIQYKKHESDKEYSYKAFDWFESNDIEIIGNIYEKNSDVK